MKNILFILTLIPSLIWAQGKEFVITGHIKGLHDGVVKITTTQQTPVVIASDSVKNGQFSLKGAVTEPGLYFLVLSDEQPQYVFLENVPITITGDKSDIKKIRIEGSAAQNDFAEFNQIFVPMFGELNALAAQLQRESNETKRTELIRQYDSVISKVSAEITHFVSAKRSSYVSPFLLWVTSEATADILQLEKNYQLLDSHIRHSQIGRALGEYIAYYKVGAVGTDAIDFTQNDTSGKAVSLSSFRGKYVLVDFWASWCRPCRLENPNVVNAYNKYKNKNFTVLGVSLDQQRDAWIRAIEKDGLTWTQVSDLQHWNNAAAQLYRIQSIPGNMLIDPNGKIIAKDLRGPMLEETLAKYLGSAEIQATQPPVEVKKTKPLKKTTPAKPKTKK